MKRNFVIAGAAPLRGQSHNAENLENALNDVLERAKIKKENVHLVLRDAAKVMIKMARIMNFTSFDCFIHKIQLV